jgi:hypothetical protein
MNHYIYIYTILFFLIFTRQVDDYNEIFKGPHWNLLANGKWATANFKPCDIRLYYASLYEQSNEV